jgi:vacuolar-type H+-ATPase subunit H
MTLERRAQALLDLVEEDRCRQCDAIIGEARARAAEVLARSHADARARMRELFADERQQARERVDAAQARLQTRSRLHEQRRAADMLALGWRRLPEALLARWRDAGQRQCWVDAVTAIAIRVLPRTRWQIVHGPDWAVTEQRALCVRVTPAPDLAPTLIADAGIAAGLKIAAGGNVVDGTLAGLVSDRTEVGARLLRYLEPSA